MEIGDYQTMMNCDNIEQHAALLERLGGLPETTVQNQEWLYMLAEDTRQSLAIEGFFATDEDLKAVLAGRKSDLEIANYFRAAQTVYDQALQYYRDHTLVLNVPMIRHIHSELFRELDTRRGEFRKGGIQIHGASVRPPEFDVEPYVRAAIDVTDELLRTQPMLVALAQAHVLFESIHPFHDGNGRVGRILLNYLAISRGYPPIVIKGLEAHERRRYYAALEAADSGLQPDFPAPEPQALIERLAQGNVEPLVGLLCEGLLPRLDRLIVLTQERREPLSELAVVSERMGIAEASLRQRIHRRRHLAIKRGKKLYSHPHLGL